MIRVFDRQQKKEFTEDVFGGSWVDFGYNSRLGRLFIDTPALQKQLSRWMGSYQDSRFSARKIPSFIKNYSINMDEFEEPDNGYASFNEFFIRRFRPDARRFPSEPYTLGSPAEGRLSVFPLRSEETALLIKGKTLSLPRLLGSSVLARRYVGGYAFVFRLCPVDYHRFHFPDAGTPGPVVRLGTMLHSVNPAAHAKIPDIFLQNERQLCVFQSQCFGELVLMEIGATCVGRIIQSYKPGQIVARGDEKGYFAFGGSTTVLFTLPGYVDPSEDLIERTEAGMESYVRLGESLAAAPLVRSVPVS